MNRSILNSAATIALGFAITSASIPANAESPNALKTVIHSQSELPTFSYKVTTATVSALFDDDAALLVLAEAQREDAQATLMQYEIADKATLRDLYGAIRDAALLGGDAKTALANSAKVREFADKPAERLTSGLRVDAAVAAMAAGDNLEARNAAFQETFAKSLSALPWGIVRDDVTAWKGESETPNVGNLLRSMVVGNLDDAAKESRRISWDVARGIIRAAIYQRRIEPHRVQAATALGEYINAQKNVKTDIWNERSVSLDNSRGLTPVIVAVWDTGVDTSLFRQRLYTNNSEKADGKDDDGNGFIDDIHGISYDENDVPAIGPLQSFDATYPGREAELRQISVGISDMQESIDSPAVKVFHQRLATLTPETTPAFMQAAIFYDDYAHGTLVAGIAMQTNPAARLMVIRSDSPYYKTKPPTPTLEKARLSAKNIQAVVDYMRSNGVRVVNMSWGGNVSELERDLEANAVGKNAQERTKIAMEFFNIGEEAMTRAFRKAPDILFVATAGNSNTDIGFARHIPGDINLPNLLTVGAVDEAGNDSNFTSYGERVRVYANGFQVESVVPGGSKMRKSGTSFASPQVTNLASKLFALNPKLTPTDVIKLILDGSTKSADGKRSLINPKASLALLEAKH